MCEYLAFWKQAMLSEEQKDKKPQRDMMLYYLQSLSDLFEYREEEALKIFYIWLHRFSFLTKDMYDYGRACVDLPLQF